MDSGVSRLATSPAHKLGQIIGNALELSALPLLEKVAQDHALYLDKIGPRAARGGKKLITWTDADGNKHNLDFVLERGGTDAQLGSPVAFIEVAWRRYTKHSVNKAGEIAGALIPLRHKHSSTRPFVGAVVAGVWTEGGRGQMTNQGIRVLYVPLNEIIAAFAAVGVDVDVEQGTPDAYLLDQVNAWDALTSARQAEVVDALISATPERYAEFRRVLDEHLQRQLESVFVLPLFGELMVFQSPADAISELRNATTNEIGSGRFIRIEVQLRFSNGDRIEASFQSAADAVLFLEGQT